MGNLASQEIQTEIWPNPPPFTGFDLVVHTLFDDINIVEIPSWVPDLELSAIQADCVTKVMKIPDDLWEKLGIDSDPAVLRKQPEWQEVMRLARLYLAESKISDEFRQYCMSPRSFFEKFEPVNPFLGEGQT